jgi:hypothetical protein
MPQKADSGARRNTDAMPRHAVRRREGASGWAIAVI